VPLSKRSRKQRQRRKGFLRAHAGFSTGGNEVSGQSGRRSKTLREVQEDRQRTFPYRRGKDKRVRGSQRSGKSRLVGAPRNANWQGGEAYGSKKMKSCGPPKRSRRVQNIGSPSRMVWPNR